MKKKGWLAAEQNLKRWQKAVLGMNSNNPAGPAPPRLPAAVKPRMDSLQSQRKMEKKLKKQNDQNDENKENGMNIQPHLDSLQSEQENDKNKEKGSSIAPLLTQEGQTSNSTSGPPLLQPLAWLTQPRPQPLFPVPATVSVEAFCSKFLYNPVLEFSFHILNSNPIFRI